MKQFNKFFIVLIFITSCFVSTAQQKQLGSWTVINTRITVAPSWEAFLELQARSQTFYNNFFYNEIKGGFSYFLNKNFSLLVGTGKYRTYTSPGNFEKPLTADEWRFWQQITMNNYLEKIKFEHRYRIEQRWFTTGYRNRFRYRLNMGIPLFTEKKLKLSPQIISFNEIFLTNKAPFFERNRFMAGVSLKLSNYISLQPAYVHQYDYRNFAGAGKNFFQLTVNIDMDGSRSPFDRIPGSID